MFKFIKKYWTHIVSIMIWLFIFGLSLSANYLMESEFNIFVLLALGLELLLVVLIWVMIIYYIVYAATHSEIPNRVIKCILIHMFCYWYIPCFKLKYVDKDKNYKVKNIIYLIFSIILSLVSMILFIKFSFDINFGNSNYEDKTYISYDNIVEVTLPSNYRKRDVGEYDLYFSRGSIVNVGMFLYDDYGYSAYDILEFQEDYLLDSRDNMKLKFSGKVDDRGKDINVIVYEGSYKDTNNVYSLATITFDSLEDYVVYVIIVHEISSYDREEVEEILCNIDLAY